MQPDEEEEEAGTLNNHHFLNGWKVGDLTNHFFLCNDLVHHPIETSIYKQMAIRFQQETSVSPTIMVQWN